MVRRSDATSKTVFEVIPFLLCPAKTYEDEQGKKLLGRSVFEHCLIVGEVARALISRFPEPLIDILFPPGSALIAAVHDIGKVSPTFFLKLQQAVGSDHSSWRQLLQHFSGLDESRWGGHAGVSALTLSEMTGKPAFGLIVGQHHGATPEVGARSATDETFGGDGWQQQRCLLVDSLKQSMQEDWPQLEGVAQLRILAGLTSVADWIGSGEYFEQPSVPWQKLVGNALDHAGFIVPKVRYGLDFGDIFHDPGGAALKPNHMQISLQRVCDRPGVYIVEAPMGLGKTEAALWAAYSLLASGNAQGIYFALPTQLTSNKIYERFNQYLAAILAKDSPHRRSLLLHGNAWLQDVDMGEEGSPGGSWFNNSKRGLLAPFAVGTLDQALMAAMNVKHGFVRAFGLVGKVVILDEVHSYDAYTSVILDELINLLRQINCTVIILSATLNRGRREQLLGQSANVDHYPLITVSPNDSPIVNEHIVASPASHRVALRLLPMDSRLALEEALMRAELGQQVLWIENTVQEAQTRYLDLAARCLDLGIACGLLHSRFTMSHRQRNEDQWVSSYGKQGWAKRAQQGRILIGTQVVEQSIDIDADFLVTRIAPTDMLLQRIGRLWRHQDTPRPAEARCEAWILAPEIDAAYASPEHAFSSTAMVYNPYVLCRSLVVWKQQADDNGVISLPNDIRPLIYKTYDEHEETGYLAQWKHTLYQGDRRHKGLYALRQLARLTLSQQGKTLPESKAQTRYSEQESAEILLVKRLELDGLSKQTHLILLDGSEVILPWQRYRLTKLEWKKRAARLLSEVVLCRQAQCPRQPAREWCQKIGLGQVFYLGHAEQGDVWIAIAVVSETHELLAVDGGSMSDKFTYRYRELLGLLINKRKES